MAKTILIIDFDKADLQRVSSYLIGHGYQVLSESRSDKGLEVFFERYPDMVFINLLMPQISGMEVIKKIKGRYEGQNVPVFFISPLASPTHQVSKGSGAAGVVPKPIDLGGLLSIVERYLGPGDNELLRAQAQKKKGAAPAQKPPPQQQEKPRSPAAAPKEPPKGSEPQRILFESPIKNVGMMKILSDQIKKGATGRLELETETITASIKWKDGRIVGLTSPDLIPHLVRIGKLSKDEAAKIKIIKRTKGLDTLAALHSMEILSDKKLDVLIEEWRYKHLIQLAELKSGMCKFFKESVSGSLDINPLRLVYHAARAQYDMVKLQDLVQSKINVGGVFQLVDDVKDTWPPDNAFSRILELCRKGTTLTELFMQGLEAQDILAAVYSLVALDLLFQKEIEAPPPEKSAVGKPATSVLKEPTTNYNFESTFNTDFDADISEQKPAHPVEEIAPDVVELSGNPLDDLFDTPEQEILARAADEVKEDSEPSERKAGDNTPADSGSGSDGMESSFENLGKPKPSAPAERPAIQAPAARNAAVKKAEPVVLEKQKEPPPIVVGETAGGSVSEQAAKDEIIKTVESRVKLLAELMAQGDQCMKSGEYSRAADYFNEIILVDPDNVDALVKLARSVYRNKFADAFERMLEAVNLCKKALTKNPEFVPALLTLVKIFEEENRPSLVHAFGKQVLEIEPGNAEIRKKLQTLESKPSSL